jgi:hypothetical protein
MNKDNNNIKLLGEKLKFKDGTEYMRMPNGELRRMSPKAAQIRKINKNK